MKRIVIVQGHPDSRTDRFGHALTDAYAQGALQAGHSVTTFRIADLDIPFLRSKDAFENEEPAAAFRAVQDAIADADHLVIEYPLWIGDVPALLKAFLEHVFRPHFAGRNLGGRAFFSRPLRGKSAHVIVTMGMPAFVYRWYFGAHSLKSLKGSPLGALGIRPVRTSVVGSVQRSARSRRRWLERMTYLGTRAR